MTMHTAHRVGANPFVPLLAAEFAPTTPRNPFAAGALLPYRIETKNSVYVIHEHAILLGDEPTCTVVCETGTFAGKSWRVNVADVALTPGGFHVGGGVGLHTTTPVSVNDYPVEKWLEALAMDLEDARYLAELDAKPTVTVRRVEAEMVADINSAAYDAMTHPAMVAMRMKHDARVRALQQANRCFDNAAQSA